MTSLPWTAVVTAPWFLAEVRGWSRLYYSVEEYGWGYLVFSFLWFLAFTDFGVYWIHRFEHHPSLYWWLHKPHHTWKVSTPFASFAFHPLVSRFFFFLFIILSLLMILLGSGLGVTRLGRLAGLDVGWLGIEALRDSGRKGRDVVGLELGIARLGRRGIGV